MAVSCKFDFSERRNLLYMEMDPDRKLPKGFRGPSLSISPVLFSLSPSHPLCRKHIKGCCLSLVVYSPNPSSSSVPRPFLFSPCNLSPAPCLSLCLTMPDYPPVRRNIPSPPGPPAGKITKKPGAPKAKGAVRAKSGCYTCRIRRKVGFLPDHPPSPTAHSPLSRNATNNQTLRGVVRHAFASVFSASALVPSVLNG